VELGREPDQADDVRHLPADLGTGLAHDLERVRHVGRDRPVREKLVVLEDDADVAAQVWHPAALHRPQRLAGDEQLAL
jgi:hypothetical protein